MVSFDLTSILDQSGIPVDLKMIQEFGYALRKDVQQFVGNISNLTVGLSPSEGVSVSNLPEASFIRDFINNELLTEIKMINPYCVALYRNHVFNLLVSAGYIPLGWIHQNTGNVKEAQCIAMQLRSTWEFIVSDYFDVHEAMRETVYTKVNSFGLMTKDMAMGKKKIFWYLVIPNQQNCDIVQMLAKNYKINNLVVYNDSDYDKAVVESTNRFLFQFDRIVDPYVGTVFKVKVDLKSSIPTYLAMIGCDKMCIIEPGADRSDYQMIAPHYVAKEYKRSQPIETTVRVPSGYIIDFVALNGTPYFVDTYAMVAAGIEIIPMDSATLTGYQTYKVIVSGQSHSVKLYIDACQDYTGIGFSRQVISTTKSKITVGDTGIVFNIAFNFPFIFFNTDKVHVFAKKNNDTQEEEVLIKQVMIGDTRYSEKSVTIGSVSSSGTYPIVDEENTAVSYPLPPIPSCGYSYPHIHHRHPHERYRENPNVIHCLPPYTQQVGNGVSGSLDTTPESRVMIFSISESGSIVITFDGYVDYKYFRITFDDRAMIAYVADNEVIPVIEVFKVVNPTVVKNCECGPDCSCDKGDCNCTETPGDNSNPVPPVIGGGDGDNEGGESGGLGEGEVDWPEDDGNNSSPITGNENGSDSSEPTTTPEGTE